MAKNIRVRVGDTLANFQDVNITRFNTVDGEEAEFVDFDEISSISSFTFFFDGDGTKEYDSVNAERFSKLSEDLEAGNSVLLHVDYYGELLPASVNFETNLTVSADFPDGNGYLEIKNSSNRINYTYSETYAKTFSESGRIPATQAATAEWVKAYVDETITDGEW